MGKKLFHASHFDHSLRKRSPHRYQRIKEAIQSKKFLIKSHEKQTDPRLFKYWKNRKTLFSKVDDNSVYMTSELWFSVTPEVIAKFLATFVKSCLPNARTILDVFCGGGGNTIQFAKLFPKVYGIDYSVEHLYCTAMNCKAYDVSDRVWLRYGSWNKISEEGSFPKVDCIFGSPPWGGPEYLKKDIFDLENNLLPMGITKLLRSFLDVSSNVILFLPRNSDLQQLSRCTRKVLGAEAKCKVLYVKTNGYMKGMLCMWGEAFTNYKTADNVIELEEKHDIQKEVSHSPENNRFNYDIDG